MSLLSPEQKNALKAPFQALHDTFKRKIVAYKEAKKVAVNQSPGFNSVYQKSSPLTKTEKVSKEILARVYFPPKGNEKKNVEVSSSDNLNLQMSTVDVRLKVSKEDYDFLEDTERVEIDGEVYRITSAERPNGIFEVEYYVINLKKLD